ncbi:hypothetical protein FRB94_012546, partial [Tulasnella sp. JGI-2019a]
MDSGTATHMDPYIRSLTSLIEGVHNGAKKPSASKKPNKRERTVQDSDLMVGQRIKHHIADMTRRRTPIHHLPNELLANIFALTLPSDHDSTKYYWDHLFGLRLVSKRWNGIIHETPSLWAQISSEYSDRENKTAAHRSKDCPLQVYYSDEDFYEDCSQRAVFLNFASRLAYRWRSAEFDLYSHDAIPFLRSLVSLSAPSLEKLKIDCSGVREDVPIGEINIFDGGADRLRHVDLYDFPIPWSSQLLSRLETLKIEGSSPQPGPSTSEITDILRQCPELHAFTLSYHDEGEIRVSDATPSAADVVPLPALTSLTLSLDNANAVRRIVSSVRIPACTHFHTVCHGPAGNIFSNEASHLAPVLISAIQSAPEISLKLGGSEFSLKSLQIHISLKPDSALEDLTWLVEHTTGLAPWPPIAAKIFCDDALPFPQVAGLLCKMPSITKLILLGDSDQYIAHLSYPILSHGIHEWFLPNLRELRLEDCPGNSPQLLINLSSKRQEGAGTDRGDGVPLRLPMKLEIVYLEL